MYKTVEQLSSLFCLLELLYSYISLDVDDVIRV